MADNETSYCKNLQIYLGKEGRAPEKEQEKRVVMDLVSVLQPGHGITTDNFFTSLHLAENLLDKSITIVGTVRKNKPFIPQEFLPCKSQSVNSSIFGYQSEIILVSYVTKRSNCVILLSSEHHTGAWCENEQQKPEIIQHYNATKGAVDTLDKMVSEYTCNRQSRRWPMVLFMIFLDVAAVNAFVLWTKIHPEWEKARLDRRRLFLLELGKQLVEPQIRSRLNNPTSANRFAKCQLAMMKKCIDYDDNSDLPQTLESSSTEGPSRGRCYMCHRTIELVGPSHRTMVTILTNIAYSVGLVALAVVAYLVRDWRQLALATSVPFLTFFLYWWVLPESPRWLLARGRFDEAEKILNNMARVNGRCLNPNYILDMKRKYQVERFSKEKCGRDRSYGVLDLFRTPNLRRKTIIITFIWFTNTSVYVGLSYYAAVLGGDEFLNFLLAGVVELPTYVLLWPSMEKVGRRWTLCISMLIGGFACLATILSQHDDMTTLVLYCIGKMGISSSYVVLPLMASELYPTVVRGLGMSTSSVAGMLGPVFIPIVNYMGEDMLVLPLLVMGGLLVAGGGCSLLLPETLHQHLPQTLEDGENFGKEWFNFCPNKIGMKSDKIPTNMPESPIKSLLHVSLKETPASTPLATDLTSSTDVTSDTIYSLPEQTLRVTVV